MTTKEYDDQKKIIDTARDIQLRDLNWEFVSSNNKYKKGDIIEDHIGKGKIEKMKIYFPLDKKYPDAAYLITILNKDGKPTKLKDKQRYVYFPNIKENKK